MTCSLSYRTALPTAVLLLLASTAASAPGTAGRPGPPPPPPPDQIEAMRITAPVVDTDDRSGAPFMELDPVPVGSASLAQVHRGVLSTGEEVAVKVRKPMMLSGGGVCDVSPDPTRGLADGELVGGRD